MSSLLPFKDHVLSFLTDFLWAQDDLVDSSCVRYRTEPAAESIIIFPLHTQLSVSMGFLGFRQCIGEVINRVCKQFGASCRSGRYGPGGTRLLNCPPFVVRTPLRAIFLPFNKVSTPPLPLYENAPTWERHTPNLPPSRIQSAGIIQGANGVARAGCGPEKADRHAWTGERQNPAEIECIATERLR